MIEGKEWDDLNESIKPLMFKYGFLDPSSWKRKAARLKYAADRLFDLYDKSRTRFLERFTEEAESGKGPVEAWHAAPESELGKEIADIGLLTEYCVLMGYAIENLLKGILMGAHPEYFKPDAKITDVRSHNLISLCKRCSLPFTSDEEDLLKRLTEHIEWVGKYPVPLEVSMMYPRKKINGTWDGPLDKFSGNITKNIAERLYARFRDSLSESQDAK